MRLPIVLLAVLYLCSVSPAHAQSDFSQVNLRVGQIVYVTDPSGIEVGGPLTALSPTTLTIDGHQFRPVPGLKVQRRGDRLWDGAVWGASIGSVIGMFMASGECGVDWGTGRCIAAGSLWGAVLGTVSDVTHIGRTTVFQAQPPKSARAIQFVLHMTASTRLLLLRVNF